MMGVPYKDPEKRREHNRKYYQKRGNVLIRAKTIEYRRRNLDFADEVKVRSGCVDCKQPLPACVLQFDHIGDDKEATVSNLALRPVSLARLQVEIEKCEVVCANCHILRTYFRRTGVMPNWCGA